jgi:putative transposase
LKDKAAQLRRYQRRVSRRVKGSRRRSEAKRRLARLHRRIADGRKDFTHKVSAQIASSANVVVLETLHVAGMVKNHNLARSLNDAAMSELHRQIGYKVARRGGTVIRVDRWAPTSKVCSGCGHRRDDMPLSVRSWTCPECGSEHDRDVNAAKNVLALGRGTASMREDERGSGGAEAPPVLSVEPRISAVTRRRTDRRKAA